MTEFQKIKIDTIEYYIVDSIQDFVLKIVLYIGQINLLNLTVMASLKNTLGHTKESLVKGFQTFLIIQNGV